MIYRYCGNSGLQLPILSLGLWHNFGAVDSYENSREMMRYAFDQGITHFDLANNYGPPPGSAEITFSKMMKTDFAAHRDELIISSKAGHLMWEGPYGDGSSRKSLFANIDQSLKRTGLDYFDIYYSHRYDANTPVEETMQALTDIVRQGKALYVGLSKYPLNVAQKAFQILKENKVPCLIFQDRYNMFVRNIEGQLLDLISGSGSGFISFSPLAQGLLTKRYIDGIPQNSRAAKPSGFLKEEEVTPFVIEKVRQLNVLAQERGQTLAEMALSWVLRDARSTSAIIGASSVDQIRDNVKCLENLDFSSSELKAIDMILI
ncbi:MAG: aldo/keto reductase [Dysgonomonas sp.]